MEKDFDIWNNQKKLIEQRSHRVIHEWEILWCSLGLNIGHEQDWKNQIFERPVLVIRKFSNEIVWCIPISSKLKSGPNYQNFSFEWQEYCCILS